MSGIGLGLELTERQRTLFAALLPVFVLFLIAPLLDLLASTWPLRFDEIGWRFGFFGILLTGSLQLTVAAALVALVGGILGQRGTVRTAAVIVGVLALVMMVAVAGFGLDALQVRRTVPQVQKDRFDATSFKTMVSAALLIPVALWLSLRLLKAAKGGGEESSADRGKGLVVGQ
jgi:hypothetical protein